MNNVAVLMSTYNGELYIRDQIKSILAQKDVNVILYIRDDGSNDKTCQIIEEMSASNPCIHLIKGRNIGWKKSFFECLKNAGQADFYAFSDQDDVWLPDKLYQSIKSLSGKEDSVALYAGNVWVTDEKLKIVRSFCPMHIDMLNRPPRQMFLQDGMPGGLTYVFTNKARTMLLRLYPGGDYGHDYLLFRICLCFGEIIYDSEPKTLYRQHGNNAIGASGNMRWWIAKKIATLRRKATAPASSAAKLLLMNYSREEYKDENLYLFLKELSEYPNSIINKIKLICNPDVKRRKTIDTYLLYLKILMGKL